MERRASLVLMVLVQSATPFRLDVQHYLRPEGLKLSAQYREPLSEFMDYDPDQNKYGGNGLYTFEFPANIPDPMPPEPSVPIALENKEVDLTFEDPRINPVPIVVKKEVDITFEDPGSNALVFESFITEKFETSNVVEISKNNGIRMKRDLGFVDSGLHDFGPRRFRGKMRM